MDVKKAGHKKRAYHQSEEEGKRIPVFYEKLYGFKSGMRKPQSPKYRRRQESEQSYYDNIEAQI